MRRLLILFAAGITVMALGLASYHAWLEHQVRRVASVVREGDLVFQLCPSKMGIAIRVATGSIYDHVGIVLSGKRGWLVCEAVEEVRMTPLDEWVRRGIGGVVAIRRLKNEDALSEVETLRLRASLQGFLGEPYGFHFGRDGSSLYCSELVWKAYGDALNLELCPLRRLTTYSIHSRWMISLLQKLCGGNLPLETLVVAPSDLLSSAQLKTISL